MALFAQCSPLKRMGLALLIAGMGAGAARAQNATWVGNNAGDPGEWVENNNWNPAAVPSGTATFNNTGFVTSVSNSSQVTIGTVNFTGAQAYTISANDLFSVTGTGFTNNSTSAQKFDSNFQILFQNNSSASAGSSPVTIVNNASLVFQNFSTAGTAIITNNTDAQINFFGSSTAATSNITNLSGTVTFNDTASAASATIINNGVLLFRNFSTAGTAVITNNGTVQFLANSSAGGATITNNVQLDFLDSSTAATSNITNSGSSTITFNNTASAASATIGNFGSLIFNNSSTAGSSNITNNAGGGISFDGTSTAGTATIGNAGTVSFNTSATAANANITNNSGAFLNFNNSSTAGGAGITNNAGGTTQFFDTSTAGTSTITNVVNGTTQFFVTSTAGSATINNNGGLTQFNGSSTAGSSHITNNNGATLGFFNSSSAGSATITNNAGGGISFNDTGTAGTAAIGNAGTVSFNTSATAGNANITNNSGAFLNFNNASTAGGAGITNNTGGTTQFFNTSSAGNATITNVVNGITQLFATSTAGSATINNNGGLTRFNGSSTAGTATITTNSGGGVFFVGTSSGGLASFVTNAGGVFDMSALTSAGTTAGSIAGAGSYFLGSKTLTVGGNNLSTTVGGVIADGGLSGGAGGSLIKVGTGTLTLSGIDTYTGPTTVNAGTLSVNGSIAASSVVTVNSGATLAGTGTVSSTVINAGGTISPGNSIGTLNVSGTLKLMSGSTYVVEVLPTTADRLNVSGTATLAGTVQAVFLPGSGLFMSNNYTILSAPAGRIGTFDAFTTVNQPVFLTVSLSYTATDVLLMTIRQQLSQQPGLTANQVALAATLDNSFNSGHGTFAALFGLSANQLPGALNALSGDGTSGTQETAFGAGDLFITTMMEQGAFWRSGQTIDPNGTSYGAMNYAPDKPQAPVFKAMPVKTPIFEERWRAWAAGFDGTWRLSGEPDPGSADLKHRTGGGAAGVDYQVNPNLLVGVAAGGSTSTFSVPDRMTSGSLDGAHIGTYGVARWGGWYAAGALAFNAFDNRTNRTIAGVGPTEMATGSFRSDMFSGRLEAGYRQAFNGFAITPFAAVQFAELWLPGYGETSTAAAAGAPGILGLTYGSRTVSSLPTFLGAQIDARVAFANGMIWSPYARVSWVHEFDPVREINASFITLPGTAFTVDGPRAARDAVRIDAGSKLAISQTASLFGSFDGEFSNRSQAYAGKGGIKVGW